MHAYPQGQLHGKGRRECVCDQGPSLQGAGRGHERTVRQTRPEPSGEGADASPSPPVPFTHTSLTHTRNRTAHRGRDLGTDGDGGGTPYAAAALSLVLHSANPHLPTFRSDVRYFECQARRVEGLLRPPRLDDDGHDDLSPPSPSRFAHAHERHGDRARAGLAAGRI